MEPGEVRPAFDSGDADLNEFFTVDSILSGTELLAVTYVVEMGSDVVGFFSLSNDVISLESSNRSAYSRVQHPIPHEKRYPSTPAVKIARLATCRARHRNGLGTEMLDYIKAWFTHGNKTGCRFITVDAYNNEETINFYEKNKFNFLVGTDENEDTRLLYFDLKTFIR